MLHAITAKRMSEGVDTRMVEIEAAIKSACTEGLFHVIRIS